MSYDLRAQPFGSHIEPEETNWVLLSMFGGRADREFSAEAVQLPLMGKLGFAVGRAAADFSHLKNGVSIEQEANDSKSLPKVSIEGEQKDGTAGDASVKMLSRQEVIETARNHFPELDLNDDGFITEKELSKRVEDPSVKGGLAQTVAVLYRLNSKLNFAEDGDGAFGIFAGISRADLDKAESVIKEKQAKALENTWSGEYLDSLDKDKDGKLQSDELRSAVDEGDSPSKERELFEYFIKNEDKDHPVKISDVLHYFFVNKLGDQQEVLFSRMDFLVRHTWENQNIDKTLFATEKPNDGVGIYGISQGNMGDCYFLSSIAAVAAMTPETIKEMINDNKDGTYTVTFPGARDEPLTVAAPTDVELGIYNGAAENGIWGSVLEKAYGKWCQKNFLRRTPLNWAGGMTTAEGAEGGGWHLDRLLTLLTGKGADQDWRLFTRKSVTREKLLDSVGGGEKVPVVAWQRWFRQFGVSGVKNHVYSVLDFDPNGADGGTVTLYNPWGHKESITFKQFRRRFTAVAYRDK